MQRALNYIPNALSISRIPLAALFVVTFSIKDARMFWTAMAVICAALATDVLDGYLARKWRIESETGYLLDGLGDKVFYAALLLVIARETAAQAAIVWALLARELIWYGVRAVHHDRQQLKFMRSLSLTYAFVIRLYFFAFVVVSWYALHEISPPDVLSYYGAIGVAAAAIGLWQIAALSKMIIVDFEGAQNDGR